nr:hypothetical protein [Tanacetum cinerariifolium]
MTSAEIDHIVAQRVTDAIKVIAVYEEIHMAHDSMNHVVRQGTTIERNLTTRGSLRTNQRITECHNNFPSRNQIWKGLTLLELMKGRDCKTSVAVMNQRAHAASPNAIITCYECGRLGHVRNECQKLRNQNQVIQIWKEKARRNSSVDKDKTNA